ncbi:glutamate receptor 3,4 [Ceratobasidium sp. AG-Ba]|nr:glutamate receptor 3,4 [Ceratobasidium sp. AG-Ba]
MPTWIKSSVEYQRTSSSLPARISVGLPSEPAALDSLLSASDEIPLRTSCEPDDDSSEYALPAHAVEPIDHGFSIFDADLAPDLPEDEDRSSVHQQQNNPATEPWPNMIHYFTYMLFHSIRLGFSTFQKERILWWAKLCGMKGVPTMYSLDKCEKKLHECGESPIRKFTTSSGDILYMNDLSTAVRQDFSNPSVRPLMELYPTDGKGAIEEFWDGEKLAKGEHLDQLTPMVASPNDRTIHYYVNELCELEDGDIFIPKMFFRREGGMWAHGYLTQCALNPDNTRIGIKVRGDYISLPVDRFRRNCIQIMEDYPHMLEFDAASSEYQKFMPHPLRGKAAGRPVYSIPLVIFQDDVSANRTKQWNKHHVVYSSNAALPRKEMNRASNVRFVGSSPHAKPLEMMRCVMQMCEETFTDPVAVWDVATNTEVLVRLYCLCISADNQMHVEHCSSTGMQSTYFCRICMSGGPQAFRATLEGFSQLFKPGEARDLHNTIKELESQWEMVLNAEATSHLETSQRKSGVKDPIAQPLLESLLARRNSMVESNTRVPAQVQEQIAGVLKAEFEAHQPTLRMNPLLQMKDFDVHKDTPIEILHTVLLGAVKYYWRFTVKHLDKERFRIFKTRFESLPVTGLNMKTSRVPEYICRYPGSLVGNHFRFVVQLAPFALRGLVPSDLFRVWLLLGRLTVMLWYTKIPDIDKYCEELTVLIDDFLHAVSVFDPLTITTKAKLHILTHAPYFVRRFGPLLGPDSERYESYNSNFRLLSVLSTRLAPSHDAALAFARIDRLAHIVSGGWWYSTKHGRYVQAGPSILKHMQQDHKSRALFSLDHNSDVHPGYICPEGRRALFSGKTWEEALGPSVSRPDGVDELVKQAATAAQAQREVTGSSGAITDHQLPNDDEGASEEVEPAASTSSNQQRKRPKRTRTSN